MSLLYADFADQTALPADYTFQGLFSGYTNLTDASDLLLPSTTVTTQCYRSMFSGCTSLTNSYVKAAYINTNYECYGMFDGCTATGAVLHTTTANKASWDDVMPSTWTTWTANDDWN